MAHFVILLSLLSVIHAHDYNRECLFHRGRCVLACPLNMHPYNTRCDGETKSQRTCERPDQEILGYTCGWSRCDCNSNLLLNEKTGICVENSDCPSHPDIKRPSRRKGDVDRRRSQNERYRLSKRVKVKDDTDDMLP